MADDRRKSFKKRIYYRNSFVVGNRPKVNDQ